MTVDGSSAGRDRDASADALAAAMSDHRYVRVEPTSDSRRHLAVCSCGWKSAPTTTAGMAGTAWDQHRDTAAAQTASFDPPGSS